MSALTRDFTPPDEHCGARLVRGMERHVCWQEPKHEGKHKCWQSRIEFRPCDVEWTDEESDRCSGCGAVDTMLPSGRCRDCGELYRRGTDV